MTIKNKLHSLNFKLILIMFIGGLLCFGLYKLLLFVSNEIIVNFYLSEKAIYDRSVGYLNSFSEYVDDNGIRSTDVAAIGKWTREEKYIYMIVYNAEGSPSIEAGAWGATSIELSDEWYSYDDTVFPVDFSDGKFFVAIYNYNEIFVESFARIMSLALSFLAFIIIMLLYNRHIIASVRKLKHDTGIVAAGNLNSEIRIKGSDEIAELAGDIDKMRSSIISRMEKEQSALKANRDLITSISHDIRTPLTALIGYLDMIKAGQYDSKERLHMYIDTSLEKAMQLKKLTDELFGYFLVFGKKEAEINISRFDGNILFQQLLGEHVLILENSGYNIRTLPLTEPFTVNIDADYLKRVFDNLFGNIAKYADKERQVVIMTTRSGPAVQVCLANYIPKNATKKESTNIGLKTCEALVSQMGGKLLTCREDDKFSVEVILPAEFPNGDEA